MHDVVLSSFALSAITLMKNTIIFMLAEQRFCNLWIFEIHCHWILIPNPF